MHRERQRKIESGKRGDSISAVKGKIGEDWEKGRERLRKRDRER